MIQKNIYFCLNIFSEKQLLGCCTLMQPFQVCLFLFIFYMKFTIVSIQSAYLDIANSGVNPMKCKKVCQSHETVPEENGKNIVAELLLN